MPSTSPPPYQQQIAGDKPHEIRRDTPQLVPERRPGRKPDNLRPDDLAPGDQPAADAQPDHPLARVLPLIGPDEL